MGLDATVYCNCIERGLLQKPHPYPDLLEVGEDGLPWIEAHDLERQIEHDNWIYASPCVHDCMRAASERLGNAGGIGYLHELLTEISRRADAPALPVLLDKVLYSGTHCGDMLSLDQVAELDQELQQLRRYSFVIAGVARSDEVRIGQLVTQLQTLVDASRLMNRPISF